MQGEEGSGMRYEAWRLLGRATAVCSGEPGGLLG